MRLTLKMLEALQFACIELEAGEGPQHLDGDEEASIEFMRELERAHAWVAEQIHKRTEERIPKP